MSSADRIESAVYFTDRCGASIEVKRDMFASCGLTHGHDGAHEPVELGEQTTSESPAAAQDRGCLSEQAPDTVSGGGTPGTSSAARTCVHCGQRDVVAHGGGLKCRACGAEEQRPTSPSQSPLPFLRPRAVWINRHTRERTVILDFEARVERVPDAAGGFKDDHQLVVHHTANVPPGFERGWGDDAVSFAEHWEPQTVTKSADFPITEERPRDVGAPGAAT